LRRHQSDIGWIEPTAARRTGWPAVREELFRNAREQRTTDARSQAASEEATENFRKDDIYVGERCFTVGLLLRDLSASG